MIERSVVVCEYIVLLMLINKKAKILDIDYSNKFPDQTIYFGIFPYFIILGFPHKIIDSSSGFPQDSLGFRLAQPAHLEDRSPRGALGVFGIPSDSLGLLRFP